MMRKNLDDDELLNYEFSKLFVDYINNFNLLDSNLYLCIGWFITGGHPNLAYPLISKLSVHEKIQYLKNTINDNLFEKNKELVTDFNNWISKAIKAKCQRNKYVHGRWMVYSGASDDKCILFELHSHPDNINERFSLKEFENISKEMHKIFYEFIEIREKHLRPYEISGRKFPG